MIETELPGSASLGTLIFKVPSASRWLISRMLYCNGEMLKCLFKLFPASAVSGRSISLPANYFAINKLICQQRMFRIVGDQTQFFTSLSNGICRCPETRWRMSSRFAQCRAISICCQRQWRDRLSLLVQSGVAIAPPNDRFKYPCCSRSDRRGSSRQRHQVAQISHQL